MAVEIRLLTVEDYHRMKEAGVFHPEERVELIAGQLIQMAAKGTAHTAALRRTNQFFYSSEPASTDDGANSRSDYPR